MGSSSTRDLVLGLAVLVLAAGGAILMVRPEPEPARVRWKTTLAEVGGLEVGGAVTYRGFRVGNVEAIQREGVGQRFLVSLALAVDMPPRESLIVELARPVPVQPAALVLWDREPGAVVEGSPPAARIPMTCQGVPAATEDPYIASCRPDVGFASRLDEIVAEMRGFTKRAGEVLAQASELAQHNLGPGSQLEGLLAGAREKASALDVASLNAVLRNSAAMTGSMNAMLERNQAAIADLSRELSGLVGTMTSTTTALAQDIADATRQMSELAATMQREPESLFRGRTVVDPPLVSSAGPDSR